MTMRYEELTNAVRGRMRQGFEQELIDSNRYVSPILTESGRLAFDEALLSAIDAGNEESLARSLMNADYWTEKDARGRTINVEQAAHRIATSEFNTWYVWALSRILQDEGESQFQVYRAADPKWTSSDCAAHEGVIYPIEAVIDGHRIKYWPEPGLKDAFSIPAGPGCHHTIRRVGAMTSEPAESHE